MDTVFATLEVAVVTTAVATVTEVVLMLVLEVVHEDATLVTVAAHAWLEARLAPRVEHPTATPPPELFPMAYVMP